MEIWKDIKGHEGFYQISNLGRVKSLKKWCGNVHLSKWVNDEKILTPQHNGKNYLYVTITQNKKRKNFYIHRLVAEYFLSNPQRKPVVNHKDFDTSNNTVDNLEWVTQKENIQYSAYKMKHPKSKSKPTNTGEKYISFRKEQNRYRVCVYRKEIGCFKTLDEAIKARDNALKV